MKRNTNLNKTSILESLIKRTAKKVIKENFFENKSDEYDDLWELDRLPELAVKPDDSSMMNESKLLSFITNKWNSPANRIINEDFKTHENYV